MDFEPLADVQARQILNGIADPEVNQQRVKLEVAPKVAVYSPKSKLPWDDAVTWVLTYAEIPYDVVYDAEVVEGNSPPWSLVHAQTPDGGVYSPKVPRSTPQISPIVAPIRTAART